MPRGGSWSRDDVILFTKFNNDRIFRIAAAGGEVTAVTTIDRSNESAHWWPQFLPDAQHFLYYVSSSARPDVRGLYLAGLDGTRRRVVETTSTGVFAPPGFLLFPQSGSLVAQSFDVTRGELVGTPVVVAEQLAPIFVSNAPFSISETGVLVLLAGAGDRQLAWRSRSGAEEMLGDPGPYVSAAVSGRGQVLVTRVDPVLQTEDLWLIDAQRGIPTRVTSHGANDNFPFWLSNAAEVIFSSNRNGRVALWRKIMTDGAAEEGRIRVRTRCLPGLTVGGRPLAVVHWSVTQW